MASIKQGSTFEATVVFSENEWLGIYPWQDIIATVGQESRRYPIEVTIYENARALMLSADTDEWTVGPANLDLKLTTIDGRVISIPNAYSIELLVIERVS